MASRLLQRGFLSLAVGQFFGAANDNLLKGALSFAVASGGLWAGSLGPGGQAYVGYCLLVPFLLLSGYAGQIADRFSKQRVSVIVKVAEIGIALVGLGGFLMGNFWISISAMLLLGIQSAFFGPAKYGVIPELVGDAELCRANGFINMSTNIAIIVGTLLAGPVYDAYVGSEEAKPLPWIPGQAMLALAVLGCIAIFFMPKLKPMDPGLRFDWNPFRLYFRALREMSRGPLLAVALAWAFFYLVATMALLILADYRALLGVTATKASILMGILGFTVGLGSVVTGLVSGKDIRPGLIPVGAVGLAIFFFLLGGLPLSFGLVAALLAGAGFFAGFYIVPLQALLQHLSPADERGRFLGAANALSSLAGILAGIIFRQARATFEIPSNRIFLLCGALAAIVSIAVILRLRRLRSA